MYEQTIEKDPIAPRVPYHKICYSGFDVYELNKLLKEFSYDALMQRIKRPGVSSVYAKMISNLASRVHEASEREETIDNFTLAKYDDLADEYREFCSYQDADEPHPWGIAYIGSDNLLLAVKKAQRLRDSYMDTSRNSCLPQNISEWLELKLQKLDESYDEACFVLGKYHSSLMYT